MFSRQVVSVQAAVRSTFRSSSVMGGRRVQVCVAGRDFLSSCSGERNSSRVHEVLPAGCVQVLSPFEKGLSAASLIPESLLCN
jgi:hypothetical protein